MSMINYNREEGKGMLKLRFLPVLLALFLFSCASGDAQAENVWRTLGASFDPFSGTITYYTRPAGGGDLYPEMDIFFSLSFSDDGKRDYRIYFDYPSEPLVLYSDGNPVVSFSSAIEDTYARSYIPLSEDEMRLILHLPALGEKSILLGNGDVVTLFDAEIYSFSSLVERVRTDGLSF